MLATKMIDFALNNSDLGLYYTYNIHIVLNYRHYKLCLLYKR